VPAAPAAPAAAAAAPAPAAAPPQPPPAKEKKEGGGLFGFLKGGGDKAAAAKAPKAPKAPSPPKPPKAAKPPKPPKPPKMPKAPTAPAGVKAPQVPKLPKAPKAPAQLGGLKKLFGGAKKEKPEPAPEPAAATAQHPTAAAGTPPPVPLPPGFVEPTGYQTWQWPAAEVEKKSPLGKIIAIIVVLLLLAAIGGIVWYTLLRDDDKKPVAKAAVKKKPAKPTPTPKGGDLKTFVFDIEPLLKQSAANRAKIVAAVRGVSNGCSLAPDQGAAQAKAVQENRTQLLQKVNALKPPNAQAAQVKTLFKQALTASITANDHYAKWMASLKDAKPCPGSPTKNTDFNAAESASKQATAAKAGLAKAFNPLAAKFKATPVDPGKI
jgi:hypothetical protein